MGIEAALRAVPAPQSNPPREREMDSERWLLLEQVLAAGAARPRNAKRTPPQRIPPSQLSGLAPVRQLLPIGRVSVAGRMKVGSVCR